MQTVEEFVQHFGVKGMKWGVHRSHPSTSTSEDSQRTAELRNKVKTGGTKALSNKEMQDLLTRMDLEQRWSRMNPSKVQKGLKVAQTILSIGGTLNQAVSFINSPAGKAIKDGLLKRG